MCGFQSRRHRGQNGTVVTRSSSGNGSPVPPPLPQNSAAPSCYYQGCSQKGSTREHIPPRSFFPTAQRNQLLTVKSCQKHNNNKSVDDLYVLAHICLNASPRNGARDVFRDRVKPQLTYNGQAFKKMLRQDAVALPDGSVRYSVDTVRLDTFFSALSCGLLFNLRKAQLPIEYALHHVYHNFSSNESPEEAALHQHLLDFYSSDPPEALDFGRVKAMNAAIYSVKVYGVPAFEGSITIVHEFFNAFRVTSMLTRKHLETAPQGLE